MDDPQKKPAFARSKVVSSGITNVVDKGAEGMTMREHYAGEFMAALIAHEHHGPGVNPAEIAKQAVRLADALIQELDASSFK